MNISWSKSVGENCQFWMKCQKNGQVQDAFSTTSDQHNDPIFAEHIVHGSKNPPEKEACKNIHPLGQGESPKGANLTRQAANLTRHDGN